MEQTRKKSLARLRYSWDISLLVELVMVDRLPRCVITRMLI